jgi:hypothetical protein
MEPREDEGSVVVLQNEKLKEKFVSGTRKTFDGFTTKDSYTWNITHNTESTAV